MKRKHINDICIGDKFIDGYGDTFEVKRFQGEGHVFLECSDSSRDTYSFRDKSLLDKINQCDKS